MKHKKWICFLTLAFLSCSGSGSTGPEKKDPPPPENDPPVVLERFSVTTEKITFDSPSGPDGTEITLAGDLHLPDATGKRPAIVMMHGSGQETRSYYSMRGKQFTERGIGALAYDKQGAGLSGGTYTNLGTEEDFRKYATDALSAIELLRQRPEVDPTKIGVMGNSQAGWIIPIMAAENPDLIAFTLFHSCPTVSVGEEILYSSLTGDNVGVPSGLSAGEIAARLRQAGPSGFDPLPFIENMTQPGFWMFGALDKSIPVNESVSNLETLILRGKNFQFVIFPNGNHGLMQSVSGGSWEQPPPSQKVGGYWQPQEKYLVDIGIVDNIADK